MKANYKYLTTRVAAWLALSCCRTGVLVGGAHDGVHDGAHDGVHDGVHDGDGSGELELAWDVVVVGPLWELWIEQLLQPS